MKYLLDSDIAADALKGQIYATELLKHLEPDGLALSIISYIELREGILGSSKRAAHERGFRAFLRRVRVLTISRPVADRAAAIRSHLRSHKQPVSQRALDLLIGATALEHGLVLITRNRRDYADIPGLTLHPSMWSPVAPSKLAPLPMQESKAFPAAASPASSFSARLDAVPVAASGERAVLAP